MKQVIIWIMCVIGLCSSCAKETGLNDISLVDTTFQCNKAVLVGGFYIYDDDIIEISNAIIKQLAGEEYISVAEFRQTKSGNFYKNEYICGEDDYVVIINDSNAEVVYIENKGINITEEFYVSEDVVIKIANAISDESYYNNEIILVDEDSEFYTVKSIDKTDSFFYSTFFINKKDGRIMCANDRDEYVYAEELEILEDTIMQMGKVVFEELYGIEVPDKCIKIDKTIDGNCYQLTINSEGNVAVMKFNKATGAIEKLAANNGKDFKISDDGLVKLADCVIKQSLGEEYFSKTQVDIDETENNESLIVSRFLVPENDSSAVSGGGCSVTISKNDTRISSLRLSE